ncbi:DUF2397 domain-containing protein [Micromonospora aurantiaca]|uniref:DUF2397 domain-containing protein n=1 Tax=Micromonospora aurantiaca (nom. illeg.) TaxID=47850 RepID=UPI0011A9E675|nr:DUF2397 family protein [Micromonospora aurantiaca]UFN96263.1 DUF2397 domain-containing protein [Micromonospora aurantiaca]
MDLWQLAGLPGGLVQASYLVGRRAAQYRLIVDVLLAQQQHSLTGIAAAELPGLLRDHLAAAGADPGLVDDPGFSLERRMRRLEEWRVVEVWQDRARRDEDFLRNLDRYQLTEVAADLHRAVSSMGQDVAADAAATLAPSVLTSHLGRLRGAIAGDPSAAAEAWAVINPTLTTMANAAAGWQGRLAGALAGTPDAGKLAQIQDTLRRYVDMWGAGIDTHSDQIASTVRVLLETPEQTWRQVAVHGLGATADGASLDRLAASYVQTLETLGRWFDGPNSQARRLRRQMRDTISPLVRGQRTLAAVGGHVSRRAELLALAGRLEAAEDDATGWEIWCRATGLFSARHLPGAGPAPAGNPGAVSFWDAEPAPVAARLRKQGPRGTTGSAARIPDRSQARAAARAAAAQKQAARARTEEAVLARSGLRLSQWRDLTEPELEMLLELLATLAAARLDESQVSSAMTGDGRWMLRADPAPDDHPTAVVATPTGRLVHPDIRLHITAAGRAV